MSVTAKFQFVYAAALAEFFKEIVNGIIILHSCFRSAGAAKYLGFTKGNIGRKLAVRISIPQCKSCGAGRFSIS
jgi:hypothetical protein